MEQRRTTEIKGGHIKDNTHNNRKQLTNKTDENMK